MFRIYTRELAYTDTMHGLYFDKDNGAIIDTSLMPLPLENRFFKQLQNNINVALKPLIKLINKAYQEEMNKYTSTGGMFLRLPQDHPASMFLNLKCILETDEKFFGLYKPSLPNYIIANNNLFNSMDAWSTTLAYLTHVDCKEAYKLLLKLNACKKQHYFVDPSTIDLPIDGYFIIKNQKEGDDYKKGIQKITSFAEFQKKIEKSILYIISKATQEHNNQNQI